MCAPFLPLQVSYSDRLQFSPASHTRTWMDLPYNPDRPPSLYKGYDPDEEDEDEKEEDVDVEAFRRTYRGFGGGGLEGAPGRGAGELWSTLRMSLRKRRRALAARRRREQEEREQQEAWRSWQAATRPRGGGNAVPRGCCVVS